MNCLSCGKEMEITDTTYSNINTDRACVGQHTGDIYTCEDCEQHFIDNFLTGNFEGWSY